MKTLIKLLILIAISNPVKGQVQDYLTDPHIDYGTKEFLKALNTSGGPALETLSKEDARQVLIGAQAAADVDFSGIYESEKTIEADGYKIRLNIVRPEGERGTSGIHLRSWWRVDLGRLSHAQENGSRPGCEIWCFGGIC